MENPTYIKTRVKNFGLTINGTPTPLRHLVHKWRLQCVRNVSCWRQRSKRDQRPKQQCQPVKQKWRKSYEPPSHLAAKVSVQVDVQRPAHRRRVRLAWPQRLYGCSHPGLLPRQHRNHTLKKPPSKHMLRPLPQPPPQQAANSPSAEPPPAGMYYEDYGTQGFVRTAADNLSTFAVDVDTGEIVARGHLAEDACPSLILHPGRGIRQLL